MQRDETKGLTPVEVVGRLKLRLIGGVVMDYDVYRVEEYDANLFMFEDNDTSKPAAFRLIQTECQPYSNMILSQIQGGANIGCWSRRSKDLRFVRTSLEPQS
jgi:hypothetical protein